MTKNRYLRILPLIVVVISITTFIIYNNHLTKKFYTQEVNSKVVGRSNWQLRATEFYLSDGLRVDSTYIFPLNIKIGDSISKKANTNQFRVYRRNSLNRFVLYNTYNIQN